MKGTEENNSGISPHRNFGAYPAGCQPHLDLDERMKKGEPSKDLAALRPPPARRVRCEEGATLCAGISLWLFLGLSCLAKCRAPSAPPLPAGAGTV